MKALAKSLYLTLFVLCLCIETIHCVKLQKGDLYITVSSQQESNPSSHKVNIKSKIKSQLLLTQSSKINIQAKLTFSTQDFRPQYFSFRLKHLTHSNLSEPVLAKYDSNEDSYKATLDLGNPKQIKPFSDTYQLEVILADENLDQNIRNVLADCNVKFRKSLETVPNSDLHYKLEQIIQTSAPSERVDPPRIFTFFVVLLILAVNAGFVYGLNHLKVNAVVFPRLSTGFLMNFAFIILLMMNLGILMKFWINWTFLQTLQYLLILILPTALIANYALVHIKKQ